MIKKLIPITLFACLLAFALESMASEYEREPMVANINILEQDYSDCAALSAMSQIPAISHHADHKAHMAVGAAVGACEGELGLALGMTTHEDDTALKASVGVSGDITTIGVGVSFGW